ncbi:hypothetical protein Q3G72_005721 [Acer saccharum]|nr:hypothetical protein Q3G72_005721 [Acer saccharum]
MDLDQKATPTKEESADTDRRRTGDDQRKSEIRSTTIHGKYKIVLIGDSGVGKSNFLSGRIQRTDDVPKHEKGREAMVVLKKLVALRERRRRDESATYVDRDER